MTDEKKTKKPTSKKCTALKTLCTSKGLVKKDKEFTCSAKEYDIFKKAKAVLMRDIDEQTGIIETFSKDSMTGKIHIHMKVVENKFYELIISDNGVGLPGHIDVQNPSTFGLNLVYLLTQQLEGKVEAQREKGTRFIIKFPI